MTRHVVLTDGEGAIVRVISFKNEAQLKAKTYDVLEEILGPIKDFPLDSVLPNHGFELTFEDRTIDSCEFYLTETSII